MLQTVTHTAWGGSENLRRRIGAQRSLSVRSPGWAWSIHRFSWTKNSRKFPRRYFRRWGGRWYRSAGKINWKDCARRGRGGAFQQAGQRIYTGSMMCPLDNSPCRIRSSPTTCIPLTAVTMFQRIHVEAGSRGPGFQRICFKTCTYSSTTVQADKKSGGQERGTKLFMFGML